MAKVTFEFPDESLAEIVSNYCEMFSYRETVQNDAGTEDIPNPQSRTGFTANKIISDAKHNCREWQRQKGHEAVDQMVDARLAAVEVTVMVE